MQSRITLILRRKIFIFIFIIILVFAGLLIYWYALNIKEKNRLNSENISIITAGTEIKAGTIFTEEVIDVQKISKKIYNEDFITDLNVIAGKAALEDIAIGEIITSEKVKGLDNIDEKYMKFSASIPAGLRAVAIPVNYYGKKSLPDIGDMVDIISVFFDKEKDAVSSITVLKSKEIILIEGRENESEEYGNGTNKESINNGGSFISGSLDGIFSGNGESVNYSEPVIITFYLNPSDVEKIFIALQNGTLNVSVCSRSDLT
jgi:Flp pilus assembly protein CpaB